MNRTVSLFADGSRRSRTVLGALAACALALTVAANGRAASSATPQISGKPVVTFHHSSSGKVYYEVVVRTTTALPRSASGTILAGARINGYGPDLDFSTSDHGGFVTAKSAKGTHCYQQSTLDIIDPPHG